ncbi:MAG: hypothetical protein KKA79_03835 [Nanoarchaeota archaeon]|nr:hypothetical protein [Nanoarchaeota archaeon]
MDTGKLKNENSAETGHYVLNDIVNDPVNDPVNDIYKKKGLIVLRQFEKCMEAGLVSKNWVGD